MSQNRTGCIRIFRARLERMDDLYEHIAFRQIHRVSGRRGAAAAPVGHFSGGDA